MKNRFSYLNCEHNRLKNLLYVVGFRLKAHVSSVIPIPRYQFN